MSWRKDLRRWLGLKALGIATRLITIDDAVDAVELAEIPGMPKEYIECPFCGRDVPIDGGRLRPHDAPRKVRTAGFIEHTELVACPCGGCTPDEAWNVALRTTGESGVETC